MKTMRPAIFVTLLVLAGVLGCQSSPRGGGMVREDSFNLILPPTQLQLHQGDAQTIDVALRRGDDFKQDVKLKLDASKGLSVDPASTVIKASAKPETQVRISAGKDVALGEYRVTVTATPSSGQPTMSELRVNVVAQ